MKQHPDTRNPLAVSSLTLAASDRTQLAHLAAVASKALETSISKSQIVRALIRSYGQRGDQHDLHVELMRELAGGRVWGTVPASRRPARAPGG